MGFFHGFFGLNVGAVTGSTGILLTRGAGKNARRSREGPGQTWAGGRWVDPLIRWLAIDPFRTIPWISGFLKPMGFHWIPLNSIEFHWIPLNSIEFHWIPLNSIEFHWIPLNSIEFHWIPLNSIEFHWIPLNSIEFHWIPLSPNVQMSSFHWFQAFNVSTAQELLRAASPSVDAGNLLAMVVKVGQRHVPKWSAALFHSVGGSNGSNHAAIYSPWPSYTKLCSPWCLISLTVTPWPLFFNILDRQAGLGVEEENAQVRVAEKHMEVLKGYPGYPFKQHATSKLSRS